MQLALEGISKSVGAQPWLYPMDLALQPAAMTVLLGATQAGKTSLMRVMAGLDAPSSGHVWVDGQDMVGVPVRQRNVAMVYQQFVNYPSMTVRENIASPMRLRGDADCAQRVQEIAQALHIDALLDRYPSALSGGQQQRVALGRALAKRAPLTLLDEPLVNLDFKLREMLREELGGLFAAAGSTVVYATTEPHEALLLGGYTAVLDAGELLQYGPTVQVFEQPRSLRVARAFSDPPMNCMAAQRDAQGLRLCVGTLAAALDLPPTPDAALTVGLRAHALRLQPQPGDWALSGCVELVEITGSQTLIYLATSQGLLVAQCAGVHAVAMGAQLVVYASPQDMYVFDAQGNLLRGMQRSRREAYGTH